MFSGCGGMDIGFCGGFSFFGRWYEKHPFRIVWANDVNEAACRTYRRNLKHNIHCGDVWDCLETLPKKIDILIGGFPCQDISINGKGRGVAGSRSGLYRAMIKAVESGKPKIVVMENVKGLLLRSRLKSLQKVVGDLSGLGYNVSFQLYKAVNYGVPQNRERVFIVGTLPGVRSFTPPDPERDKSSWMTAGEALKDLEDLKEDPAINHVWSRANKSPEQGNRRLNAAKPGHTIRAECHGNIQYHYSLPRRISMREAARLQSFPDEFIFDAKLRETERQVGNAVPPVLAWHIAKAVAASLEPLARQSKRKALDTAHRLSLSSRETDTPETTWKRNGDQRRIREVAQPRV